MNTFPIGFIDSGVGGLTIWQEAVKLLPFESTIYLADNQNCPYGAKTKDELFKLSKRLIKFLLEKQVKLIVIACNTLTVSCIDRLRKEFPQRPIIGTVPVVKTAGEKTKNKKIGILSTGRTAASSYQAKLINKFTRGCSVTCIGSNKLVVFIERGDKESVEFKRILKDKLKEFGDRNIDTLVLGCTHFPFIKRQINEFLGNKILLLDSGGAVARQAKRILEENKIIISKNPKYEFCVTGDATKFEKAAKQLLEAEFADKITAVTKVNL